MRIMLTLPWYQWRISIIMVVEFHLPPLKRGFLPLQNTPQTNISIPPHDPKFCQEALVRIIILSTHPQAHGRITILMMMEFHPHHLQVFLDLLTLPQTNNWMLRLIKQVCHLTITNRLMECLLHTLLCWIQVINLK